MFCGVNHHAQPRFAPNTPNGAAKTDVMYTPAAQTARFRLHRTLLLRLRQPSVHYPKNCHRRSLAGAPARSNCIGFQECPTFAPRTPGDGIRKIVPPYIQCIWNNILMPRYAHRLVLAIDCGTHHVTHTRNAFGTRAANGAPGILAGASFATSALRQSALLADARSPLCCRLARLSGRNTRQ